MHQYVIYEQQKPKGPKRINLNDLDGKPTDRYSPPTSLAIHLSKIDMPELKPRSTASSPPALSSKGGGKGKDKKKETSRDRGKGKDQVQKGSWSLLLGVVTYAITQGPHRHQIG